MFRLAGFGEQAGSGVPRILRAWNEQSWRWPDLQEDKERYRTSLYLPTVSMLPAESLMRLRSRLGDARVDALSKDEVMALVTADVEGQVTRGRFAYLAELHPYDANSILRGMSSRGLLEQSRTARRVYTLPLTIADSTQLSLPDSTHSAPSSTHSAPSSTHSARSSTHSIATQPGKPSVLGEANASEWSRLREIATPVSRQGWQRRPIVRETILALCAVRPLRLAELAELLNREPQALRQSYLNPLLAEGTLCYLYAGEPTHPGQAYRLAHG